MHINILPLNFPALMRVQDYISYDVSIGTHSTMNAFPTFYYFFLRDGGIVYLIFATIIFGRIVTILERKCVRSSRLKDSFTYSLFSMQQ